MKSYDSLVDALNDLKAFAASAATQNEFLEAAEAIRGGTAGQLPAVAEDRVRQLLGNDILERAKFESKRIMRADIGRGTLPIDRVWHPSELNSLSACPFIFLARHALKLRAVETPEFEVPAMEIGILVHTILRDF